MLRDTNCSQTHVLSRNAQEGRLYLQGQVPGDVDVPLVVVHPDLGHAQRVALGVEADVVVVGLLLALDVGHPGAGQHLHAAPTQPHLQHRHRGIS